MDTSGQRHVLIEEPDPGLYLQQLGKVTRGSVAWTALRSSTRPANLIAGRDLLDRGPRRRHIQLTADMPEHIE